MLIKEISDMQFPRNSYVLVIPLGEKIFKNVKTSKIHLRIQIYKVKVESTFFLP